MKDTFEQMICANTLNSEPYAPPVTVANPVDDEPCPPWEFLYTNDLKYGKHVRRGKPENLKGCNCIGGCKPGSTTCACLHRQKQYFGLFGINKEFNYDENGRYVNDEFPIFECNDACGCDEDCMNRVVQRGRQYPIEIRKTQFKGWGVFAKAAIPSNSFIGIYAGELITVKESHERGSVYDIFGRTYIFQLDFWYLQEGYRRDAPPQDKEMDKNQKIVFCVDAFHVGNFTRFLNHSCDPNCGVIAVHINEPDVFKPMLCLFTYRDVKAGEELTFSYAGIMTDEEVCPPALCGGHLLT
ncbi:SET domain-containing protein [Exidia glandulosa HHB12029]|uniref:SET domain-containing protein n=1 Tax=Exidia glandulosa HHB12029 TaxID=1314781 RepID=A0A165EE18_EXIGL|nr:SET domain-containing protein [Exidia glandulosa HHB12029]